MPPIEICSTDYAHKLPTDFPFVSACNILKKASAKRIRHWVSILGIRRNDSFDNQKEFSHLGRQQTG